LPGLSSHPQALIVTACGLIGILIAAVGALAVLTSKRVPQSAGGRAKIIQDGGAAGADSLARHLGSAGSLLPGSLAGVGGRCWRGAWVAL
jgi:hypothetical protein